MRGQGATEYLVLLAVVLVIALVGIALLGFFPGTASDAQETESRIYWQSASPIAITEWGARFVYDSVGNYTFTYFKIRNTGNYPISLTRIYANGQSISEVWTGYWGPNAVLGGRMALQPGEEKSFAYYDYFPGVPDLGAGKRNYFSFSGSDAGAYNANFRNAATSLCSRTASHGNLVVKDFGFEYVQTVEGQTITKRQVGKPLVIECMPNYN